MSGALLSGRQGWSSHEYRGGKGGRLLRCPWIFSRDRHDLLPESLKGLRRTTSEVLGVRPSATQVDVTNETESRTDGPVPNVPARAGWGRATK